MVSTCAAACVPAVPKQPAAAPQGPVTFRPRPPCTPPTRVDVQHRLVAAGQQRLVIKQLQDDHLDRQK